MVFVIQNIQNRDAKAVHAKLDELIRAMQGARDRFMLAEDETEAELDTQVKELRAHARSEDPTTSGPPDGGGHQGSA